MIDEVLADAGKIDHDLDAMFRELLRRTDAGKHQELRRYQRAGRKDDVGIGVGRVFATIAVSPCHASGAPHPR